MPRIDVDVKLDFKDVLFRPKRSSLKSRSEQTLFTAMQKHYTVEQWKAFAAKFPECLEHIAVSSGSGQADLEKLCSVLKAVSDIRFICLDVANGYSEHFVEFVKTVRGRFPQHTIMAGNVVTGEMVEELILAGADIIKVLCVRRVLRREWDTPSSVLS